MSEPRTVSFQVYGMPGPQGSKRHVGGGRMIESSAKVKPWRQDVKFAALEAMRGAALFTGPVYLEVIFYLPRPPSVSVKKRKYPSVKPDLSKLLRSTEDAMTKSVWVDDSQVCWVKMIKVYSTDGRSGADIVVSDMGGDR